MKGAKNTKPEPGKPPSPPQDASGPRMGPTRAVGTPAEHLISHQHQPGSNGGVRRGSDLVPRRDLVRRILERALWGKQLRAKLDPVTGLPAEKGRRVATAGAMVADLAQRFQRIAETGDDATVLRLAQLIHEVMQPGKGEVSGGKPRRVFFQDAPSGVDPAKPAGAPAPAGPEPPTVVDRDGNEYVLP